MSFTSPPSYFVSKLPFRLFFTFALFSQVGVRGQVLSPLQAQDYFESPHSQGYQRQKVITTMKKEVNSYSERLHDLQERFYQIFYGQDGNSSFDAPFKNTSIPSPAVVPMTKPKGAYLPPEPIVYEESSGQQLAFEVDVSQGMNPRLEEGAGDRFLGSGKGYWVIRSGLAYPYETQTGSTGGVTKYRKYKTGFLMNAVGGYAMNNWRFGAGVHFRRNLFHSSSYQGNSGKGFGSSKGATTFGALLDLGYHYPLLDDFDIILNFGAGYGVSVVQDSLSGDSRYDPTFLLLPGVGGRWNFSSNYSFDFGYRFVREDEVPVHAFELGFAGKI